MKAAVLFESPGRLQIRDISLDAPREHEVLVQVGATGLCHSDLHFLDRPHELQGPTVMGHEGAGTVQEVGSAVTYVRPGDHVISFPIGFCGQCERCLGGRPTLCAQTGLRRAEGEPPRVRLEDGTPAVQLAGLATFAEQMLVHENSVVKIDQSIPLDVAAIVGCAVPTGVGAVLRTADVPAGADVAVIGCGGVGLHCIQGAVLAGANHVIAVDINEGKLERARQFGATHLINNAAGDARRQLADLLPGTGGVDYAFEALGQRQTAELAFAMLRPGGTATIVGVMSGPIELPGEAFLAEKRIQGCLMGSVNFRRDIPYLLDLYRAGRLKLTEAVSDQISIEEINEGYAKISDGGVARTVVVFD